MASEAEWVGAGVPFYNIDASTAKDGAAPEGITPLARDIFTSDDFYVDRDLWRDPRYFRCNSTLGLDSQWGDYSSAPTYIETWDQGEPVRCLTSFAIRLMPSVSSTSPHRSSATSDGASAPIEAEWYATGCAR